MPVLKQRIDRLERAFRGTRIYTEDQWDGILLMFLSQCVPEHMVVIIRTAAIYPWAAQWYANRQEERRHWSKEEIEATANRRFPEHLHAPFFRLIIRAWNRQIPDVACPLDFVDGEWRPVESTAWLPKKPAGEPVR